MQNSDGPVSEYAVNTLILQQRSHLLANLDRRRDRGGRTRHPPTMTIHGKDDRFQLDRVMANEGTHTERGMTPSAQGREQAAFSRHSRQRRGISDV